MKAIKIKMAFEPPHKRSPTFCVANIIGPVLLEHTLNKIQLLLVNSCQSIFLAFYMGDTVAGDPLGISSPPEATAGAVPWSTSPWRSEATAGVSWSTSPSRYCIGISSSTTGVPW